MKIRCGQLKTDDPAGQRCTKVLAELEGAHLLRYAESTLDVSERRAREHGKHLLSGWRKAAKGRKELTPHSDETSSVMHVVRRYFDRSIDLHSVRFVLVVCDCQARRHGPDLEDNLVGLTAESVVKASSRKEARISELERVTPMEILGDFQFQSEADPCRPQIWSEHVRGVLRSHREERARDSRTWLQDEKSWNPPRV